MAKRLNIKKIDTEWDGASHRELTEIIGAPPKPKKNKTTRDHKGRIGRGIDKHFKKNRRVVKKL